MSYFQLIAPKQQWVDANGNPYSGGKLFTYDAGTSTKKTTYTTDAGAVANSNPIVLNSAGQCPSGVYGTTGAYKLVLAPSTDSDPPLSPIWTQDGVAGVNDVAATPVDQWLSSSLTPTYVSATQFTVPGDNTATLNVGRRLKTQNTTDTTYSRITVSSFGAGVTTVTVASVSGTLDSGLSSVAYGIISGTNQSQPDLDTEVRGVTQTSAENSTKLATTAFVQQGKVGASWVLLQDPTTAVAASSVTFTGLTGYDDYVIVMDGVTCGTNNSDLWLRISLDNGGTYKVGATDYRHSRVYFDSQPAAIGSTGAQNDTKIVLAASCYCSGGTAVDGEIRLNNLASGSAFKGIRGDITYFSNAVSAYYATAISNGSYLGAVTAINAVQILFSAGTISGKFRIFGVRSA